MVEIVFGELRFFKSAFSRSRTWLWFCLMVVAFMGNCDPIGGIAGLVRTLGLDISAYSGFLNFFQSTAIDRAALQASVFHWLRLRFKDKIVTIGGRELLILDAKKQAKSGKRMPGVKWHHQESSSASKKEYVTAHSFECLGLAINCVGCVSCLVFLIRMIDGVRKHNRDGRTLKEKVGDLITTNTSILTGRLVVCDAWYAAQQILLPAMRVSATIVTRVGKDAVACCDPIRKAGARGRPPIYGDTVKLLSLFGSLKLIADQVKNCSGQMQDVTYWSIKLMWKPIKRKVLFVGSQDANGRKIILLCTDLSLCPLEVIQAYVYRSSIEHTFWLSTQFFVSWTYRFSTKLPLVNSSLKGNFNLHWSSLQLREAFQNKVQAYEIFLTMGFLAHSMFVYLGMKFKSDSINDNILFFRSKNRESGASIPIMRAIFCADYRNFIHSAKSSSEPGKFLIDKHKVASSDRKSRKAS